MRTKKVVIIKEELIKDAKDVLNTLMKEKGFEYVTFKGEQVWKKGKGFFTAPKLMKFNFIENNKLQIEAWIKTAILPGIYVGESDLDSNYGFLIKAELKSLIKKIYEMLSI
jgi:hypothetical protein